MAKEDYELMSKKLAKNNLEYKIIFILAARRLAGKPLDEDWLRKQDRKIIYGIYFDIINSQKEITVDQCINTLNQLGINNSLIEEYLQKGYEEDIYNYENDLYDENGVMLSDGERLGRRMQRHCQINTALECLKEYPRHERIYAYKRNERKY